MNNISFHWQMAKMLEKMSAMWPGTPMQRLVDMKRGVPVLLAFVKGNGAWKAAPRSCYKVTRRRNSKCAFGAIPWSRCRHLHGECRVSVHWVVGVPVPRRRLLTPIWCIYGRPPQPWQAATIPSFRRREWQQQRRMVACNTNNNSNCCKAAPAAVQSCHPHGVSDCCGPSALFVPSLLSR